MCIIDLNECDCDCHRMEGTSHMMPCCDTCPDCGRHIVTFALERHRKQEHPREVEE